MRLEIDEWHFSSLDSTNSWAKRNTHLLDENRLTLVVADSQTGGRGRLGRQWISPKGNLYASFVFFLPLHDRKQTNPTIMNVPQVLALAAVKTLEDFHVTPRIKWPNDLLVSQKKMGGILSETKTHEEMLCVILGIGINVNMGDPSFKEVNQPITSLSIETKGSFSVDSVKNVLKHHFQKDLIHFLHEGFSPFYFDYTQKLIHQPYEEVIFSHRQGIEKGLFDSISKDGSLNLLSPTGEVRNFITGEILYE